MVVPLASAHLRSLGYSHFMTGFLGSTYAAIQLVSGPLFGSWSDVRGRRPVLLLTLLVCSLCYLLMGIATALPVILLIRIGLGIFKQTQTLCKTLVADIVPYALQPEVYGRLNAVSSFGFMIGPVLGGHLAELEDGFFYICCIVGLNFWIIIGIAYMFVPDVQAETSHKTSSAQRTLVGEVKKTARLLLEVDWSVYWDVFALKFLLGFSQAFFYTNYSLAIQEKFQVSPKWIGYTISFQGMIGAFSGFLVGWFNKFYQMDSTFTLRSLHGFLLLVLAYCAVSSAPTLGVFVLSLVPLSVSSSFLRIIGLECVLQRTPLDKRGSVVGSSNSISSIARLVAPLCSGAIHDVAGYFGVSLVSILTASSGAALAGFLRLSENRKAKVS
ncbi:major facilitator superfamily domain-containing protein 9 isoform X2 [Anabrus simplex]